MTALNQIENFVEQSIVKINMLTIMVQVAVDYLNQGSRTKNEPSNQLITYLLGI